LRNLKVTDFGRNWNARREELLEPTRIYVRPVKTDPGSLPDQTPGDKGLAHITGGGLVDNLPRILPPHRRVFRESRKLADPPVFPGCNIGRHRAGGNGPGCVQSRKSVL